MARNPKTNPLMPISKAPLLTFWKISIPPDSNERAESIYITTRRKLDICSRRNKVNRNAIGPPKNAGDTKIVTNRASDSMVEGYSFNFAKLDSMFFRSALVSSGRAGTKYSLPFGESHLQEPSEKLSSFQPWWVFKRWCLRHKYPKFARLVSPPSSQLLAWSISEIREGWLQPGNRQVRSRAAKKSTRYCEGR